MGKRNTTSLEKVDLETSPPNASMLMKDRGERRGAINFQSLYDEGRKGWAEERSTSPKKKEGSD